MASSSSNTRMFVLKSSDGDVFDLSEAAALKMLTVKRMVEDNHSCGDNITVVPLPNLDSKLLSRVVEYSKRHDETSPDRLPDDALRAWDKDFVKGDYRSLCRLIDAASYLDLKSLMDLACQALAGRIEHKTPAQIRHLFNIKNDYTPEQEAALLADCQKAFSPR